MNKRTKSKNSTKPTLAEAKENEKYVIRMDKASHDFGGGAGIFDIDIRIKPGTILGFIGPSGCGKTTTIRLVNGTLLPTSGEARVFGIDPKEFSEMERAKIGYIPQQFILYPNLSVEENLHFLGSIYGMTRPERISNMNPLLDFVGLDEARKRLGGKLSGGMQRRLMLAGALLHEPELLIADEPTAGIDPILRAKIWDNFRELKKQGKTLLVTTQYVGEASYCDLVAVMRRGRLVVMDTPRELQRRAMGGEVIQLKVPIRRISTIRRYLEGQPGVLSAERQPNTENGLFVIVDDAGKMLPKLIKLLRDEKNLVPDQAEHYLPSFDEVFVRLIQQDEQENQKVAI